MKLFRKNGTPYQSALKRVPLKIRFKVVGHDEYGFPFENEAETVDVGPGGGCLTFDKDVKTGENLRLYSPKGDLFLVNVRWFKYDMRSDRRYVGFNFWNRRVAGWLRIRKMGALPGSTRASVGRSSGRTTKRSHHAK